MAFFQLHSQKLLLYWLPEFLTEHKEFRQSMFVWISAVPTFQIQSHFPVTFTDTFLLLSLKFFHRIQWHFQNPTFLLHSLILPNTFNGTLQIHWHFLKYLQTLFYYSHWQFSITVIDSFPLYLLKLSHYIHWPFPLTFIKTFPLHSHFTLPQFMFTDTSLHSVTYFHCIH